MIRIYLCDDDPILLDTYHTLLKEISAQYSLDVQVSRFSSGEQLLFRYEDEDEEPEVIFLDVIMGGDNGVETARKLRALGCTAEIIFLTANPEYVFESFEVSPANYLLKNTITRQRFEEILVKALAEADQKSRRVFTCENGSVQKNIPIASIYCFEVSNRTVTVYYDKTSFTFYSSLEEVQEKLKEGSFLRVHRSYLVRLPCIEQLERTSLTLSNGQVIPVGVTYAKKVKEDMNRYFSLQR